MTPEEFGQQNAKDSALAHEAAEKHYHTEEMAVFRGAFTIGFRAGLDHERAEIESQAVQFRLENARKLEVENAELREEIDRLRRLDFCPQ